MTNTVGTLEPQAQQWPSIDRTTLQRSSTVKSLLPRWVWIVAAAFSCWGFFTTNPLLTPFSIIALALCIQLLWRPGEPPVLFFACMVQWLQAALAIFHSDYLGLPIDVNFGGLWAESATYLALIGVLVLAFGIRLTLTGGKLSPPPSVSNLSVNQVFVAYVVAFLLSSALERVAFVLPGISQLLFAIVTLKWAVLFTLFYVALEKRQGYLQMAFCFAFEAVIGMVGFFSNFKTVFFVLVIALLSSPKKIRGSRLTTIAVLISLLLLLGVVWSAIKGEYRDFLNQGTNSQQVLVPLDERAEKLVAEGAAFSQEQFDNGVQAMLLRISYVQYFAMALESVPTNVPYEDGDLWFAAIKHVFTPRLLFPDKPILDDSDMTQKYLGIAVAGLDKGTSIGMGYMAESYIDFGRVWMFAPIFLLGVFYGLIYRFFIARKSNRILGFALGVGVLSPAVQDFASSNVKIFGGVMTALIISFVAFKILRKILPHLA
jgi:hypothetical protein